MESLATLFFEALVEESNKLDSFATQAASSSTSTPSTSHTTPVKKSPSSAHQLLEASLALNEENETPVRVATWTLRLEEESSKILSVTRTTKTEAQAQQDLAGVTSVPSIYLSATTLRGLMSGEPNPRNQMLAAWSAYNTGKVQVRGDLRAWMKLSVPGRAALKRVFPLLEERLPWPTFSQVEFVTPASPLWVKDEAIRACQVCGDGFGVLISRKHHCRACGRIICGACSSRTLKGNRTCDPCFARLVVGSPNPAAPAAASHGKAPAGSTGASRLRDTFVTPKKSVSKSMENKAHQPSKLVEGLYEAQAVLEDVPIPSATCQTNTERLLKARAIASLGETRAARKDLDRLKESAFSWKKAMGFVVSTVAKVTPHILAYVFLPEPARIAWFVATLGDWRHSAVPIAAAVALRRGVEPSLPNVNVMNTSALILGISVLTLHTMFHRLVRIYSLSFYLIGAYQLLRVVSERVLRLSLARQEAAYARLDAVVAPWALDAVLDLRSVFVKFGQYLGARSDIVPPAWNHLLAKLQDDMPSDDLAYVEATLTQEGFDVARDFPELAQELSEGAIASASIAQVHRVTFVRTDGSRSKVALKVQHKNVEGIMRADMVAFRRVVSFAAWLNERFAGVVQILDAWEREMFKELDFRNEAENLTQVAQNLAHLSRSVIVPQALRATQRVLVMTWVDGFKITDRDLLDLHDVDRRALLARCVAAYGYQIFVDGALNCDPHPGNLFVQVDDRGGEAKLVLLDFGMVVTIQEETRLGFCEIINGLAQMSVSQVSRGIQRAGYENTQSAEHPERDLEYFAFLLRDTSNRKASREESKQFNALRGAQKRLDVAEKGGDAKKVEGRAFKSFPDELLFLLRTLGLLRGLCTTLDVPVTFLETLVQHARIGLAVANDRRGGGAVSPARSLASRTKLGERVALAVEATPLVGGLQYACMVDGKLVLEEAHGTLGDLDARRATNETLFPLLELSRVVATLVLLDAVRQGRVASLDVPLLGANSTTSTRRLPTLRSALCHDARSPTADAVPSSSFGHALLDADAWLSRVAEASGREMAEEEAGVARSHTFGFGFEADLALRSAAKGPVTLARAFKQSLVRESRHPHELAYGPDAPLVASGEHVASVSHGYAASARAMMGSFLASGGEEAGGGAGAPVGLSNLPPLPGRICVDPSMVNDPKVRASFLPGYNGFASARALCDALHRSAALRSGEPLLKQVLEPHTVERGNPFLGEELTWGLGFLSLRDGARAVLAHHVVGGGVVLHVPEARATLVVLATDLTLERAHVRNVLRTAMGSQGLNVLSDAFLERVVLEGPAFPVASGRVGGPAA